MKTTLWAVAVAVVLTWAVQEQEVPKLPVDRLPAELVPTPMPVGLPASVPEVTPATAAQVALGRKLFFDPILSADRTVSCATCHDPEHGFASPEALSLGVHGRRTERHAPTLLNRGFGKIQFWDGRVETLDQQVLMPIENPLEMDLPLERAVERLVGDATYKDAFVAACGAPPTRDNLALVLAAFVRRLVHGGSAIDKFRAGKAESLSETERTGLWIYESKGRCWRCHSGANFSNEGFHNTGIGVVDGIAEPGRAGITKELADTGRFKTPTLRGLALTAPYMHDGSLKTLEDVVEFYRRGGHANEHLDPIMQPIDLTDDHAASLVAFLKALSRVN